MKKIIIIGAGMAGLTAGAYLVQAGYDVKIFEQFPTIGGVTATLHKEGFSWDLGPMLVQDFQRDEPAGKILEDLGIYDQVNFLRSDRGIVMPDFDLWKPQEYAGRFWRRDKLMNLFPSEAQNLIDYYQFKDRVSDLVVISRRIENSKGIQKLLLQLRLFFIFQRVKDKKSMTADQLMDEFFSHDEIKGVFLGLLADFVTKPSEFPALGVPIINNETAYDMRVPLQITHAGPRPSYQYILGGMEQLVKVFEKYILTHGGKIYLNSPVTRLNIHENQVQGIQLRDGSDINADLILACGGAKEFFFNVVGKTNLTSTYIKKITDVPLMESVHMIHLGIDLDPRKYQPAALCYYYGTNDVEGAVIRCRQGIYHEGKDGFLIYVPSLHSPEMAPEGKFAMTIYTIAPNKLDHGTWAERSEEFSEKLLIEAEKFIPNLRKHILVKEIMTPEDFRTRTHQSHHAFGGKAPIMGTTGAPHKTPIEGLWFIGSQSDKVAGGLPGTMMHSKVVVEELLKTLR
ncbi:MAG: phytoene desaturase family protein [Promethearchaeota archaeon]